MSRSVGEEAELQWAQERKLGTQKNYEPFFSKDGFERQEKGPRVMLYEGQSKKGLFYSSGTGKHRPMCRFPR